MTSAAPLPAITLPTTIDGTTESTYLGQPAVVEINGGGSPDDGLTLDPRSDGSTIDGLEIVGFLGDGIHVESVDDKIFDNLIGTDGSSTDKGLGNAVGVFVDGDNGGRDATIGGTTSGAANTIGFNTSVGVSLGGTAATNDLLVGNYIGTDLAGDDLGNAVGVAVASNDNAIGGTGSGSANVIGFNTISGVSISGGDNVVAGNLIGTNAGKANLGNPTGILVSGSGNTIGGTSSGSANVIGFNTISGVSIAGGDNVVAGNLIGTNALGANLSNPIGILVSGSGNSIGGTSSGSANVIDFNTMSGVSISGGGNLVEGNIIIATIDPGANPGNPIGISVSASNNTIGGPTAGAGNTIGDAATGINVDASDVVVEGNFIGTNSAGANLANTVGVSILVSGNTIGGSITGAGNTIGDNATGINLGASGVLVMGNVIGTDSARDHLGNTLAGIVVNGVSNDTIGGTAAAAANLIGFNTIGISIAGTANSMTGSTANRNIVWGNFIGTDTANDDLGNQTGIVLSDASDNSIGGTLSGTLAGSSISGTLSGSLNGTIGAWFSADFSVSEANGLVVDSSTISGVGNIIGFNSSAGVSISSGGLSMPGNLVIANLIGASEGANGIIDIGNATGVVLSDTGKNSIGQSLASLGFTFPNTIGGTLNGSVSALGGTIPLTFSEGVGSATLGGTVSAPGSVGNLIVGNTGDGIRVGADHLRRDHLRCEHDRGERDFEERYQWCFPAGQSRRRLAAASDQRKLHRHGHHRLDHLRVADW